jgi:host factor-I protein
MSNRKLIRPNLKDVKAKMGDSDSRPRHQIEYGRQGPSSGGSDQPLLSHPLLTTARRKQAPPEQTYAENFYYLKQMTSKTVVVIIMEDGEEIRGIIEWYDKNCLKVNRMKEPNLLIMKARIKYMYKQEEESRSARRRTRRPVRTEAEKTDAPVEKPEPEKKD